MKRAVKITSWIAVVFLICLTGTWWYLVKKAEWDARLLFNQALRLKVGNTSLPEVLDLLNTAPGRKYGFEPCLAGLDGCTGTIYIANIWLFRFHLAPPIAFVTRFGISDNKLTNRELGVSLEGMYGKESYGLVSVNERVSAPDRSAFKVSGWSSGILVNMTTEAPENLKSLAYNFNFHCLVKIGGCKNYEEMLPILERKDLTGSNPWRITNK